MDEQAQSGTGVDPLVHRLHAVRQAHGKTQAEFAEATGVSRSFVSDIESGRSKPSAQLILGVAEAFPNVDRDWLLSGQGCMFPWQANTTGVGEDGTTILDTEVQKRAGNFRFGSDAKLSTIDPDALELAFTLLSEVSALSGGKPFRKKRKQEFIALIYNLYMGALFDAMQPRNSIASRDRQAYAEKVCRDWVSRFASIPVSGGSD